MPIIDGIEMSKSQYHRWLDESDEDDDTSHIVTPSLDEYKTLLDKATTFWNDLILSDPKLFLKLDQSDTPLGRALRELGESIHEVSEYTWSL